MDQEKGMTNEGRRKLRIFMRIAEFVNQRSFAHKITIRVYNFRQKKLKEEENRYKEAARGTAAHGEATEC